MHYSVAGRIKEIGVRMAVGANGRDIVQLILMRGSTLAALGIAAGALGAMWLTRIIAGFLFAVDAGDPLSFTFAAALLFLVALLASYLPARRGSRIDPITALHQE